MLLSFFALGKPTTNLSRLDPFRAECKEKEYGGELTPVKWFIGNRSPLVIRLHPRRLAVATYPFIVTTTKGIIAFKSRIYTPLASIDA